MGDDQRTSIWLRLVKEGLSLLLVTLLVIPVAAAPPKPLVGWHPLHGWWPMDKTLFPYLAHVWGANGENCSTVVLDELHHLSMLSCVMKLSSPLATANSEVTVTDYGRYSSYVLLKGNRRDAKFLDSAPMLAEQPETWAFKAEWRLSANTRRFVLRWNGKILELGQVQIVDNEHCPSLKRLDRRLVCAFSQTAELDAGSNNPVWLVDIYDAIDGDVGNLDSSVTSTTLIIGGCTQRTNKMLSCRHIGKDKGWIQQVLQGNQSLDLLTWLFKLMF